MARQQSYDDGAAKQRPGRGLTWPERSINMTLNNQLKHREEEMQPCTGVIEHDGNPVAIVL